MTRQTIASFLFKLLGCSQVLPLRLTLPTKQMQNDNRDKNINIVA